MNLLEVTHDLLDVWPQPFTQDKYHRTDQQIALLSTVLFVSHLESVVLST